MCVTICGLPFCETFEHDFVKSGATFHEQVDMQYAAGQCRTDELEFC